MSSYSLHIFAVRGKAVVWEVDPTPQIAGGLLALDGLLFALAMFSHKSKGILKFGLSIPLTLILFVGGTFLFMRPGSSARQVNPNPPDSQSIQAGARLFSNYCAACHGEMAKGSVGPDLTASHYKYGKARAEISKSINDGRPGGMPAFKGQLAHEQIESLIEFLLSLK